ncbi:MAG: hypothetical protein HZA80_00260 [Candidatus Taylorbacteria bacterium]|nr:hypothetical protein [Candidatus Taylorbacteria bacterium]
MYSIPAISPADLLSRIQHIVQALGGKLFWFESPRNYHYPFREPSGHISTHLGERHENYSFSNGECGVAVHASDDKVDTAHGVFLLVNLYLLQPEKGKIKIAEVAYFTHPTQGTFRSIRNSDITNEFESVEELRRVTEKVVEFAEAITRAIE